MNAFTNLVLCATLFLLSASVCGEARTKSLLIGLASLPDLPTATQAKAIAAEAGLNLTDIQGDILVGMKKNKELFFFFNITDASAFKRNLRSIILPLITTTTQLLDVTAQPLTAVNIAFSRTGLTALGNSDDLADASFTSGQFVNAANLGDPGTSNWVPTLAFSNAVLLLASDTVENINTQLSHIISALSSSIKETYRLSGAVRPGSEQGHEHFGFLDGLSQPGIAGFTTAPVPGQDLIAPGIILTGESGDSGAASRPPWTRSGSFLAFRQLKQFVPEFNKYLLDNAITDNNISTEDGATLLGARMFGRWKSGAPIYLSPDVDNFSLANDPNRNNNFDFADSTTGSTDDQTRCPFSAHIRKTGPRADLPRDVSDPHRIIRGGIPYGPEVTTAEAAADRSDDTLERGLAFVSYQSNIDNGFAFVQQTWANNITFFPHDSERTPGFDPIIGANHGLPRNSSGISPKSPKQQLTMILDFIVSRGGEYFFSPSLSAIQNTLSA